MWLYTCKAAGLGLDSLRAMRIDQAEAWVELHEFIDDAIANRDDDEAARDAESAFWGL